MSSRTGAARAALLAVTSGVLLLWGSSELAAQTNYQVIANLANLGLNAARGGLVRGIDGAFYGTTSEGGATHCGAVYGLASNGILTVLHNFANADGCFPVGDLARGPDDSLYGTTYLGGDATTNAAGTSASSNAVTLSFSGSCSGSPLASANFLAYKIGNTIRVVWDPAPTGAATTSYVLNVSGAFNGNFSTAGRTLSGAVAPGTYNLRLTAVNACGSATTAVQAVSVP